MDSSLESLLLKRLNKTVSREESIIVRMDYVLKPGHIDSNILSSKIVSDLKTIQQGGVVHAQAKVLPVSGGQVTELVGTYGFLILSMKPLMVLLMPGSIMLLIAWCMAIPSKRYVTAFFFLSLLI